MWLRKRLAFRIGVIFLVCIVLIVACNIYLLHAHSKAQSRDALSDSSGKASIRSANVDIEVKGSSPSLVDQIRKIWGNINSTSMRELKQHHIEWIEESETPAGNQMREEAIWALARDWVSSRQVYPKLAKGLGRVLRQMASAPITGATVGSGGTQLKLTLTLKGGQKAVFKPMRYSRNAIFLDTPYAGADRHNGEIAAFHLSRLLDLRWCPLVSGRKVHLRKEILPVAEKALKNTFFNKGNETCFYGVCHYCKPSDPVCSKGNVLEGAIILWLPPRFKLKMYKHPWRRVYRQGRFAPWEVDDNYCNRVVNTKLYSKGLRLLDLIDIAIFDFLIGNADRHLYEVLNGFDDSVPLLMDNGKSFGNPFEDEVTILAPLYQCCRVRRSTWKKLSEFHDGSLSKSLVRLMKVDSTHPVLTADHLAAIDRRRVKVLAVIEQLCLHKNNEHDVLVGD